MRQVGKVEVPPEAFIAAQKMDADWGVPQPL
jgi:translation elongation factor EF-4